MLVIRILFPEIYYKIRFMFTESHFERVAEGRISKSGKGKCIRKEEKYRLIILLFSRYFSVLFIQHFFDLAFGEGEGG